MTRRAPAVTREISPDTPLRLALAAELGFPDGSMTEAGLRKEARRGKLAIERVAGKDFTTLAAIAEMRRLCRTQAKVPGSTSRPPEATEKPSGSSEMASKQSALDALLVNAKRLSKGSLQVDANKP